MSPYLTSEKSEAEIALEKLNKERPEYNSFTCAVFGHKCQHLELNKHLGVYICDRCNHCDSFTQTFEFGFKK
jgi:transposase